MRIIGVQRVRGIADGGFTGGSLDKGGGAEGLVFSTDYEVVGR